MYLEKKVFIQSLAQDFPLPSLIIDSLSIITKTSLICYHTNKIYTHLVYCSSNSKIYKKWFMITNEKIKKIIVIKIRNFKKKQERDIQRGL